MLARLLVSTLLLAAAAGAADKPNFIVLFADDLGYGDLSVYGSPNIRTPRIDRLAAEGVKLTDFYAVSPVCTPSRAGLLTGRYPVRSGMVRVLFPREEAGLPASEVTVAEALQKQGYATALIGKWHLGDRPEHSPLRHGFDVRFGLPFSNDMTRPHTTWPEPLRLYTQDDVLEEGVDQATLTRRYVDRAIAFVEENRQKPFFLYLPFSMPHWPWFATEEFDGRSPKGPYGDAIEEIDANVGRLLDALDRLGLREDTLVVFTSDNGGSGRQGAGSNGTLRGFKGQVYEGGMREPFLVRWPGKVPAATVRHGIACTMDLFPTLVKLAGGAPPSDRPFDGLDIGSLLWGDGSSPRRDLYYWSHNWESEPQLLAVREERWKLHFKDLYEWPQKTFQATELYDLEEDPSERFDLKADHPEIVERLTAKAKKFHAETEMGALPPVHFPPGSPGSPRNGGVSRAEQRAKAKAGKTP
ncbi:MAG: sulfatase-like hydrolase/transferase [Acidobacteria bacterium]|nr:sulfatase-like hydrolase/transferase [Acidobacteriota bacterium]